MGELGNLGDIKRETREFEREGGVVALITVGTVNFPSCARISKEHAPQ